MRVSVRPKYLKSMTTEPKEPKHLLERYGWDVLVVVVMGLLLYAGMSWQTFDPDSRQYECYAAAFWKGLPTALHTLSSSQCKTLTLVSDPTSVLKQMQAYHLPAFLLHFVESQSPLQPLHTLPREYPLPTLIPFSLALLAPHAWYTTAFALLMSLVALGIYVLLGHFRSRSAAMVFALYLVIGGWGTADGRFDLVPSALTLAAILCGVRKRWHWAFAFLALATAFKFYSLVLIIPFLLTQQMESEHPWLSWRRWTPLASFIAIGIGVLATSLYLSVQGTLAPVSYLANRTFQIESGGASALWVLSFLGYPLHAVLTTSLNVLSPLDSQVSLIDTALLGAGLVYVWWLHWRGKVDLATSCLLTLLIVMFTSKVFSPQYLIWVIPLAAYVGEKNLKWVGAWCLLGGLTTYIFPYLYASYWMPLLNGDTSVPLFFSVIAIRNLVLFGMIASLLVYYSSTQYARFCE